MRNSMLVFSGSASRELNERVCQYLNIPPGQICIQRFPDSEVDVKILEDVRGADVFVLSSTCPPVNESLMELLVIIDCMKRASADRVNAVIPYFGYARQDRKAEGRVPITAKLVANLLTVSGANRVLAVDLHAPQIQGFFDIPMDHLYASPVMIQYMRTLNLENFVMVSPDIGGVKMARAYAKRINIEIAIIDKRRIDARNTEVMTIVGKVKGKNVIILDDIVSTGTSMANAAMAVRENGANDIYIFATHPLFTPGCVEKLGRAEVKEIVVTDTVQVNPEVKKKLKNLRIISVANLLGEAIKRIHRSESLSALFV